MIGTEILSGQGLGNQLWCYCASRSIAGHLERPHEVYGWHNFKGKELFALPANDSHKEQAPGSEWKRFQERIFYDRDLEYYASDFDERVLNLGNPTLLYGLFQDERYLFNNTSDLNRVLPLSQEALNRPRAPKDTCILCIRGGEYKRHKTLILPKTYWLNAMDIMRRQHGIDQFIAVTDDDRYVRSMLPGVPIQQGDMIDDYMALYHAEYAIVANSSFVYFPLKSGIQPKVVIAPHQWARHGNKYGRWASPANVYDGWRWMLPNGECIEYAQALLQARGTAAHYWDTHTTLLPSNYTPSRPIRTMLPPQLRNSVKKLLSLAFPQRFG